MSIRSLSVMVGVALLCGQAFSQIPDLEKASSEVLGRIGSIELQEADVLSSIETLQGADREAVAGSAEALSKLVRSMLIQRLVLKEAGDQNWDQEPAVVEAMKRARDMALADSYLKHVSEPPAHYPSESELQVRYDAQKESFRVPKSFRVAQIYISEIKGADKTVSDRSRAKLEKVRELLKKSSTDFTFIAREYSEDPQSASRGGEIGWLTEAQIQPEILARLPKLSMNVISEPVHLEDGWHILKVLDTRETFTPVLDQVRAQLTQILRAERAKATLQAYLSKLLQDNPVAINEMAVEGLLNTSKSKQPSTAKP